MRVQVPPLSARSRIGRFSGDLHMVTGATGFLGAAISLEILRAGCGVVAVVRAGEENEEVRFINALRAAAKAYGIPLDQSVYQRVRSWARFWELRLSRAGVIPTAARPVAALKHPLTFQQPAAC
jgi:NAD(P)-dependent dehydrogenase (short-subunit alcohol dehydrogenase family)